MIELETWELRCIMQIKIWYILKVKVNNTISWPATAELVQCAVTTCIAVYFLTHTMLFLSLLLFLLHPGPINLSCTLNKQKLEARNVKVSFPLSTSYAGAHFPFSFLPCGCKVFIRGSLHSWFSLIGIRPRFLELNLTDRISNLSLRKVKIALHQFLKSTWNPNNDPEAPTQLQSQSVIEIMCAQEAYTFTNRIRSTPGLFIIIEQPQHQIEQWVFLFIPFTR